MHRFGLGPSDLCTRNPSLVYVSLSGFGSTGPWSERRSYGPTIEAASSIEARTGYAGREPLRLGHTLPDGAAGLAGALGALRGLRERAETGTGRLVRHLPARGLHRHERRGPTCRIGVRSAATSRRQQIEIRGHTGGLPVPGWRQVDCHPPGRSIRARAIRGGGGHSRSGTAGSILA